MGDVGRGVGGGGGVKIRQKERAVKKVSRLEWVQTGDVSREQGIESNLLHEKTVTVCIFRGRAIGQVQFSERD